MKRKTISMLLTATLMFALCGTAFATEADTEADETETEDVEIMTGPGPVILEDSFFSDTVTTYVESAKAVSDIVSGIGDVTYAAGSATADTLADDIVADGDIISAVTFDASEVDFDTAGEYDVVYRIFISTETLEDYLAGDDDTEDGADPSEITSDFIDVCIPGTVIIVEEDEDAEEDAEAEDAVEFENSDYVTIAEINELTWSYEQVSSIPDVVAGIGTVESDAEDAEFDVDATIVDAVIYDTSKLDAENPDADEVAYYTYFNREPLLDYMEEAGLDPADYPGLEDTTTDYIMVYYGPITELALADVIDGLTDHYVLVDSENIDYGYGVTYNDDVVKEVTVNAETVDLSEVGTYNVEYVITIDKNALEKVKDSEQAVSDDAETEDAEEDAEAEESETEEVKDATEPEEAELEEAEESETEEAVETDDSEPVEEDLEDIIIDKKVDVVDEETADELVKEGETVWTDDNASYGDTEENVATGVTQTDDKTETKDTEVADNDTDNSSSGSSSNTGSSNSSNSSGNSNSNTESSSSGSSNSSSTPSEPVHTHSYVGTVTKSATCGSSGTMTYTCSCGASYTESIPATGNHSWVENTTTREVTEGYEASICNVCGADVSGNEAAHAKEHMLAGEGGGDHSEWRTKVVGYETVGTGTYYCSVCGATK